MKSKFLKLLVLAKMLQKISIKLVDILVKLNKKILLWDSEITFTYA